LCDQADKQREREERRLARLAAQEEADAKKTMKARLQLAKKVWLLPPIA
jgi:hypothetical protein